MTTFTHKGIEISLSEHTGNFSATVNRRFVSKPSLKAMKQFIDNAEKTAFEPVPVLVVESWQMKANVKGVDLVRGKAIALVPSPSRRDKGNMAFSFAVDDKTMKVETCYRDCPETIAAYKALEAQREETWKINIKRDKEEEALEEKLAAFLLDPNSMKTK